MIQIARKQEVQTPSDRNEEPTGAFLKLVSGCYDRKGKRVKSELSIVLTTSYLKKLTTINQIYLSQQQCIVYVMEYDRPRVSFQLSDVECKFAQWLPLLDSVW